MELLSRRIVGACPASGCRSRVTVTVAVHAFPTFATDGLPTSATFRSFARAAGAAAHAATAATAMSFCMFPPRSTMSLHRASSAGSAGRGVGAAREDADAAAAQFDRHRRGVVGVGAFAQLAVGVRAVDEDVVPRWQIRDVDRLAFPLRHVIVAKARRDALSQRPRLWSVAAAVAGPARSHVRGARRVRVVQAEARLAVSSSQFSGPAKLVALEA